MAMRRETSTSLELFLSHFFVSASDFLSSVRIEEETLKLLKPLLDLRDLSPCKRYLNNRNDVYGRGRFPEDAL